MPEQNQKIYLVPYNRHFLDLSWNWLNDPEINRLTNTGLITRQVQEEWFLSLPQRTNYIIWGVMYGGNAIGVAGLKGINTESAEYFGYIGESSLWGLGLGQHILDCVFHQAKSMRLLRIWLKVLKINSRAIAAYRKFSFLAFSEDENFVFMERPVSVEA